MSVVLFLSAGTMGDALGSSGRALRAVFEPLSHEFLEVNLSSPDWHKVLNNAVHERPIAFAFSHVGMAADLAAQTTDKREVNFWSSNRIPFISFFGDSPAYYFDRHIAPGPGFAFLYAFPEHYTLRKKLPRAAGLLGVTPLRVIDDKPRGEVNAASKASGKLLFLKNGNDPARLINTWRSSLPLSVFLMLAELSEQLVGRISAEETCDIDSNVRAYFQYKGLDIEELTPLRLFFVAQLDDYLRRVKSTAIGEVLKKFPVEIRGYNWEHVDFSHARARYINDGDYTASRQLIDDALGIIDMSPNTSLRPHDRPLRAFGLYTLCITNEQEFFKRHFPEQYSDFSFSFDGDSLEDKIAEVLRHPKRFVDLGVEVAEKFRKQFDSSTFGQTILEIADCLRLAINGRPEHMQDFFVWPPRKLS